MATSKPQLAQLHSSLNHVPSVTDEGILYRDAQKFIEDQYGKVHSADICCDFPTLMTVRNRQNHLLAVVGIRAPDKPFFLEHYLQSTAEVVLTQHFEEEISREKIVEVGNLAGGRDRFATVYLMHQLWEHLIEKGFEYLMLTGTKSLMFKFRQLPLHYLADAKAEMVSNSQYWGSYYEDSPKVFSGRLKDYDFQFFDSNYSDFYQVELVSIHKTAADTAKGRVA